MKSTDIKNHKTSISQTHNLEVPGSSPGWSTKNGCNTSCYNHFLYPASGAESITSSNFRLLSENLFHAQSI